MFVRPFLKGTPCLILSTSEIHEKRLNTPQYYLLNQMKLNKLNKQCQLFLQFSLLIQFLRTFL